MAGLAIALIGLGSVSLLVLAVALLQSPPSGSVEVTLAGAHLGSISTDVALLLTAAITALATFALVVGIAALRARRKGRRAATRAETRVEAAELEARSHLLEYRIEMLSEQLESLEERRLAMPAPGKDTPLVPAAVEPRLVPGRAPRRRLFTSGVRETRTLVVVPEVEPPASPNGEAASTE